MAEPQTKGKYRAVRAVPKTHLDFLLFLTSFIHKQACSIFIDCRDNANTVINVKTYDQMSERSQVSKVTLCVQIKKWQSLTHRPSVSMELPGQLKIHFERIC